MSLAQAQILQKYGFPCALWALWYSGKMYSRRLVSCLGLKQPFTTEQTTGMKVH